MQDQKPQQKVQQRKLTKKEKGFAKDFVLTGNGAEAVRKNYDTSSNASAASIAKELLTKPEIIEAVIVAEEQFKDILNRLMPEEDVIKAHVKQLNAHRMDHMTFPLGPEGEDDINLSGAVVTKAVESHEDLDEDDDEDGSPMEPYKERTTLTDREIIDMLAEVNCVVRRIVHGESARHVYFWSPDNNARDKALDKAYKIRGRYGDEANPTRTPSNVTYNFLFSPETQAGIAIINSKIKEQLIHATPIQKDVGAVQEGPEGPGGAN